MEINKTDVRIKFQKQINLGVIKRPEDCSNCCDTGKIFAHHHDYTKPYSVIWLCQKCHSACHRSQDMLEKLPDPVDYSEMVNNPSDWEIKPKSEENHVVYVDEQTHTDLAVMAARKKISIKQCLKELIEKEKLKEK